MAGELSISSRELLHFTEDGKLYYGADQIWYPTDLQQRAGCGPTVCSHLFWYLARTRPAATALCPYTGTQKADMLKLMENVWHYVTPGRMGVNSTGIFSHGAQRYGQDHGVPLDIRVLGVPTLPPHRPSHEEVLAFLRTAFAKDLPVAFLNLSNGALTNLDHWHWVTLIALEDSGAHMYDQGESHIIDLELWLRTTTLGGGFVMLDPQV